MNACCRAEGQRLLAVARRAHRPHCSGPSPCDGCNLLAALCVATEPNDGYLHTVLHGVKVKVLLDG